MMEEVMESILAFCTNYGLDPLDCADPGATESDEESDEENDKSESEDDELYSGGEKLKEISIINIQIHPYKINEDQWAKF